MPGDLLQAAGALREALVGFEPGLLSGGECSAVVEELAATEKACAAARSRAALRAAGCGAHRERGFADGSDWLARATGTSAVEARAALETARALEALPETRAAVEAGSFPWPRPGRWR